MTQRYAELHARTDSVAQLGNVVNAMRGVAAARAQQGHRQLENVRAYADTVARAISQVLAMAPLPASIGSGHRGGHRNQNAALLLFCAENGFAGAFSERIFDSIGAEQDVRHLYLVGSRGIRLAQARNLAPTWSAPMVVQLGNAGGLAERIGAELLQRVHADDLARVDIVYARPHPTAGFEIVRRTLLPLDYARFGTACAGLPPLLNLPPRELLERLAGEYLFAQLNEAIVHSYAAENSARMQTMTAARDNIAHRLENLTRDEQLARQEEITAEIIELASGTEAWRLSRTAQGWKRWET